MVLPQLKHKLKPFVKRREFISGSGFLSCRDMNLAVESDGKSHSFLPSFRATHNRLVSGAQIIPDSSGPGLKENVW